MTDPRSLHPKPPFDTPPIPFPGLESKISPQPDFGEGTYQGTNKLAGKVALITGGDSGIGRAVAYAFACEGAQVAISYLPAEETDAQNLQAALRGIGTEALLLPGDIQKQKQCQTLVSKTLAKFGRLDILINNAAYQHAFDKITEITEPELEQTFRTNIFAWFFLVSAAWEHLMPGASIITTTSIQAFSPNPLIMPYAATKAALVNLTQSLAKEAMQKGVRVNSVAPGPIWTPLIPMSMPEEYVKKFGKQTPYNRPGQPIEVAKVFVFLASGDASCVTGHTHGVTGGEEMPI